MRVMLFLRITNTGIRCNFVQVTVVNVPSVADGAVYGADGAVYGADGAVYGLIPINCMHATRCSVLSAYH